MISTAGMSPMMALGLIERKRPVFEQAIRNDAQAKREIASFRERIGTISSVDDLMKDREVYGFVMKAFGMEDQTYAKGMVRKILTSDPEDKKSLVNRLTNSDYKELHATMGFKPDGTASARLKDAKWVDELVERFVDQRLVDSQSEISPSVGQALSFLDDTKKFTSWYKVLADKQASQFMRVALGLPESLAKADIDAQKRLFEKKMKIEDLQDPEKLQKLVRRYAAIAGANEAAQKPVSLMSLFSSATSSGSWAPVTLNIDAVASFKGYRGR